MAIRYVSWSVSEDMTVTPAVPQYGGVQGEHQATQIAFLIQTEGSLANPNYAYYIECVDAAGGYDRTARITRHGSEIATLVPLAWTQYGGISTLRLVAEEEGVTAFSVEGRLQFEDRQTAMDRVDGLLRTDLSATLDACREAADDCTDAVDTCAATADTCAASAASSAASAASAAALAEEVRQQIAAIPAIGTAISDRTLWSSLYTADRLCPPIEESGACVSCRPVAGYPMRVAVDKPNLIPAGYAPEEDVYTESGITFTRASDGSITVSGTATADVIYPLFTRDDGVNPIADAAVPLGSELRLIGAPMGGGMSTYWLYYTVNGDSSDPFTAAVSHMRLDTGGGLTFTTVEDDYDDTCYRECGIRIRSGTVCDDLVFRPHLEAVGDITLAVLTGGVSYTYPLTDSSVLTLLAGDDRYMVCEVVSGDATVTVRGRGDLPAALGDTEAALDSILAIQQSLIGGDGV